MKLSVVTPSFNSARFIEETLDSVAALATPHEHLVMDGGSTDATVEVLRGRDDPDLTWVSEPDRGQTHAVNKGLQRASGDLVGWLNADDAYVPEAVDRAVAHLRDHPEVGAVFGSLDIVDEDGALLRRYRPGRLSWRWYLYVGESVPTPTIIFRRSLLEATGPLDERYADAADYDFYLRLLHGVRADRMEEPLVRFRYYADSKTARDLDRQLDESLAIRLRWARGRGDAAVMRSIERARRALYGRLSPWPPSERVARVADSVYRVRDRLLSGD